MQDFQVQFTTKFTEAFMAMSATASIHEAQLNMDVNRS